MNTNTEKNNNENYIDNPYNNAFELDNQQNQNNQYSSEKQQANLDVVDQQENYNEPNSGENNEQADVIEMDDDDADFNYFSENSAQKEAVPNGTESEEKTQNFKSNQGQKDKYGNIKGKVKMNLNNIVKTEPDVRKDAYIEYRPKKFPKEKLKDYKELINNAANKIRSRKINFDDKDPFDDRKDDKVLNKILERERENQDKRINANEFGNYYKRFTEHIEKVENKINTLKNENNEKINRECTFIPKLENENYNNSAQKIRNPNDFLKDQIEYKEKVKAKIISKRKEIIEEENKVKNVKLMDKHSENLIKDKIKNKSNEEYIKQLAENKKNYSELYKDKYFTEYKSKIKMTEKDINESCRRLIESGNVYKERNQIRINEKNKIEKEMKEVSACNNSNKMFFDKFINSFKTAYNKSFDKEKENTDENNNKNNKILFENKMITYDQFKQLLYEFKWAKKDNIADERLIQEIWDKYLIINQNDPNSIDLYKFVVLALAIFGLYKGDNHKINLNSLLKGTFKDLDINKYTIDEKQAENIKQKFVKFYENWCGGYSTKRAGLAVTANINNNTNINNTSNVINKVSNNTHLKKTTEKKSS